MSRFLRPLFLPSVAFLAFTGPLVAADAAKPRVAVLEFKNKARIPAKFSARTSERWGGSR